MVEYTGSQAVWSHLPPRLVVPRWLARGAVAPGIVHEATTGENTCGVRGANIFPMRARTPPNSGSEVRSKSTAGLQLPTRGRASGYMALSLRRRAATTISYGFV